MKLWNKDSTQTSRIVEAFTTGRDKEFDLILAAFDVEGSLAHGRMLERVGLLSSEEWTQIEGGLNQIQAEIQRGDFRIEAEAEDVHSQVETQLTRLIGEAGKKIHSGRSRNDQVALDIKLYLRSEIRVLVQLVKELFDLLLAHSERYQNHLLPGYTHFQVAMPSSFGLWFGAYAESLVDDLEILGAAFQIVNKNPLGSGAGYGSSFPLDRQFTTELLGFRTLNYNSVYAQMSRGKTEKAVASGLGSVAATLSRLAMDCCLYLSQNFAFIAFPDELTTGSSIMPHKKNPDVFELIRARCNRIQAIPNELTILINNLPSGYHRDLQLTKEILFPALEELKSCLGMTGFMLSQVQVRSDILEDDRYRYIFSVEAVNALVNEGVPFREAYRQVGNQINEKKFAFDYRKGLQHTHEGSIHRLANDQIRAEMELVLHRFG
jgi:argininosuccinate lyase